MDYDEYSTLIFAKHYHFMGNDLLRKKFDNYLHFTEKEFDEITEFVSKYNMNICNDTPNIISNLQYYFTCYNNNNDDDYYNLQSQFIIDFEHLITKIHMLGYCKKQFEDKTIYYIQIHRKIYSAEPTNMHDMNKWYDKNKNEKKNIGVTAMFLMKTNKTL